MPLPNFYNCAMLLVSAVAVVIFLELSEIAKISSRASRASVSRWKEKGGGKVDVSPQMPINKTSKWIVLTSSQQPTESVKKLASLPDWTLVLVGDEKTPTNWSLSGAHFLSLEAQASLDFASVKNLPSKGHSRKNAGYLFAIANGAQWIYDTDDEHEPFGKGLDQFDYALDRTRGLRFATPDWTNTTIQDSLFNPYRHFGRPDMWPRGFPVDLVKNHDHHDGSYRLCREQRPPAVQQGMVHNDPDVDAFYRLQPTDGRDETFSEFAPPVILAPGNYAPWNSQNTLFSRSAFFGLFLPTTVPQRVADIWRSYFTQALLHAAGESVSFVPVNAIKRKKKGKFTKDFHDQIKLFDKAGDVLRFIDEWRCEAVTLDKCTIELAEQFASRGFWGTEDAKLIIHWINDLKKIGYVFPNLRPNAREEYPIGEDKDLRKNCRRTHIVFSNDLPLNKSESSVKRAAAKINNFGDLKDWCNEANSTKSEGWLFPAPDQLAEETAKNKTLTDYHQTVAIITNNWQWSMGMGMLQRMYEANFAMLIFCGHYPKQGKDAETKKYPEGMAGGDSSYPNLKRPFNYIHLSNEEVRWGYLVYYCLAKVEEMRIQNVKGYVMFSDDLIFNFWNPLDLNIVQGTIRSVIQHGWWNNDHFGFNAMKKTIEMMKGKYKNYRDVAAFVSELQRETVRIPRVDPFKKKNVTDAFEYLMVGDGWLLGDFMYIPAANISFAGMFAQLAHEGELFHECFTSKLLTNGPIRVTFLWGDRDKWARNYTERMHGLHPVKLSEFQKKPAVAQFCDTVLDKFYRNIFRIGNFTF